MIQRRFFKCKKETEREREGESVLADVFGVWSKWSEKLSSWRRRSYTEMEKM